jgi:penicillin-binding protein 1A
MAITILLLAGIAIMSAQELRVLYSQLPSVDSIQATLSARSENSFLYDRHGRLLYTFKNPNIDREYLTESEITDTIKLALLAAEDKDFYRHSGIDYIATIKGLIAYIGSDENERVAGGSTLTQQLAKNTFLSAERSLPRKVKEAILSLIIESNYTKEDILEYYLNTVTFGSRVTGLKTAARVYFNRGLNELSFNEVAFLVSIIQSPTELSPIYSYDQNRAWELNDARRAYIIDQTVKNYDYFATVLKDIPSHEEVSALNGSKIALNPQFTDIKAPHYVFYIQSILGKAPYNITSEMLYSGGYRIYSTLDLDIQRMAEQEILPAVEQIGPWYNFSNAALITIDPRNGDILAMQGSKNYWGQRDGSGRFDPQVNVTLSTQNLGSSLKPFVYYMGVNQGITSRYSVLMDTAETFPGGYRPKNVDGRFLGPITLDMALKYSRNLPAVKILNQVGVGNFVNLLKQLGYSNAINGGDYGLSAALGGVSETLFDHAFAYTAFANSGNKANPHPISRIESISGDYKREFPSTSVKVLNQGAADQISRILGDKSYATDNHWMVSLGGGHKFAGKTGTTDRNKQNYYIGYGPKLVTAVWVGNNNNDELSGKAFGSTTALPIWYRYTRRVINERPEYITWGNY